MLSTERWKCIEFPALSHTPIRFANRKLNSYGMYDKSIWFRRSTEFVTPSLSMQIQTGLRAVM